MPLLTTPRHRPGLHLPLHSSLPRPSSLPRQNSLDQPIYGVRPGLYCAAMAPLVPPATSSLTNQTNAVATNTESDRLGCLTNSLVRTGSQSQVPPSSQSQVPPSSQSQLQGCFNSEVPSTTQSQFGASSHSQVPASSHYQVPASSYSQVPASSNSQVPTSPHSQVPTSSHSQVPTSSPADNGPAPASPVGSSPPLDSTSSLGSSPSAAELGTNGKPESESEESPGEDEEEAVPRTPVLRKVGEKTPPGTLKRDRPQSSCKTWYSQYSQGFLSKTIDTPEIELPPLGDEDEEERYLVDDGSESDQSPNNGRKQPK